jgi:hypothetical protein
VLTLVLAPADLAAFVPLLQRGVALRAAGGASVATFVVDGLGIDPEYVRQRVTTVFLDGSVVDDLELAHLREGSLLALSAAMPGLVGATLRKGGYYGAMRADITLAPEEPPAPVASPGSVRVRVKLFNLLIEELGPALLAAGIAISPREARQVLGERAPVLPEDGQEVWLRVVFR